MNELVFLKNNQALTTSLKVAEVFDKRHDNIMQAIEDIIIQVQEKKHSLCTKKTSYLHPQNGQEYAMYTMPRDGFFMLVTGFTGKKARAVKLSFIQQFNAMEAALAERKSAQWQEIRAATKDSYKELSTAVRELYEVEKLQFIARTIIAGLIAQGAYYHQPYHDCKSAFDSYARLSFINQRLLQA